MRGQEEPNPVLTVPRSLLKDSYKAAAKKAWELYHIYEEELTDEQWESAGALLETDHA
jgi:hypothetical protein